MLRSVDAILAEDTRHARTLLDRYEVRVPTIAYHEHNEAKSVPRLLARLAAGDRAASGADSACAGGAH